MDETKLYQKYLDEIKEWKDLVNTALTMTESDINELASKMATQIRADEHKAAISTCVFAFPHINNYLDKKTKLMHKISFLLFPPENLDKKEDRVNSYIQYTQLIAKLKKRFAPLEEEAKKKKWESDPYAVARGTRQKKLWCELKERKLSSHITDPKAMDVNISDEDDFKEFLSYLKENKKIDSVTNSTDFIEFKRGIFYSDGRIDLCKQVMPKLAGLIDSIKNNPHVEHFLLGNNIVGIDGVKEISEYIKHPSVCKIKTWYLAGNNIDHNGMSLLADALKCDKICTGLWLKRNPLGVEGAKHISSLLKENDTIEILDLQYTGLLDDGIKFIMEGLKYNKTLKHLYLDANGISEVGAQYIADYFGQLFENGGLESIWLDMNRFGDKGAIILAKSLQTNTNLQRISIGSNRIEVDGIKALCEVFENHPKLFMFYCGMHKATKDVNELCNRIGNDGLLHIINLIKKNPRIQLLNISHNDIDEKGLEILSEDIGQVVNIDYEQYGIKPSQEVRSKINLQTNKNCLKYFNSDYNECLKNHFRIMKHTEKIKNIDSNYRNNAHLAI